MAGLRIETGRRLVEQQQLGFVDQRAGDRQAPLHAARQRLDLAVGALAELDELEQLGGTTLALGARDVEEAPVDHEVLGDGQLTVELVLLGYDAESGTDRPTFASRVAAEHPQGA